jgi:conjugative transposon TraJ protein
MGKWKWAAMLAAVGMIFPFYSHAQGVTDEMNNLHGVLEQLYNEMIPLCSQLIGVGQGIAGFAATWYIASRVWRHIANAEPIDFYPLFRPFALGFCILIFPSVLAMINGVMKPTVTGTAAMVENSNKALAELLKKKEEAIKKSDLGQIYMANGGEGDRDKWYRYTYGQEPSAEAWYAGIGNDVRFAMSKYMFSMQSKVKQFISEVLQVLFAAAALCINTLRTFQLIVLAILGPLVFGIAVFDGFQHTLAAWLAKYINVFLWLPVANIFGAIIGKIQEKMVALDIGQIQQNGDTVFSPADMGYLVFMIIGIVGYFTVPSVANSIVNAGGGGGMLQKVTSMASSMPGAPVSAMRSAVDAKKSFDDGRKYDAGTGFSGAMGRMAGSGKGRGNGDYQHSKLSGRNE